MTISEQIKILCVCSNISISELARRLGKTPQSFNAKLKRGSFTIDELISISEVVDAKFLRYFILPNGEKI
ncbi:XRE family transcriptional regulator [Ruminococcus flavefaciens]|uniref:XRE family transcriptional regulator n=1 Tax=Ruminococcus flavefaciens TaxID=1265 RepID=UPI0026EA77F6|nr:XRE family transcriptional regulator [Ruminococcus flavefaciens]